MMEAMEGKYRLIVYMEDVASEEFGVWWKNEIQPIGSREEHIIGKCWRISFLIGIDYAMSLC